MNEKDKERLKKFVSIAENAYNSRFIQETKSIKLEMKIEINKPAEQVIVGLDEDLMRSALIDIRKMLLEKEGVKYSEINSIVISNAPNEEVKRAAEAFQSLFSGLMDNIPPVHVVTGEKLHKNDEVMAHWIYGHYIHEDKDRVETLRQLGFLQMTHKYMFVSAILTFARLTYGLAEQAKLVLVEQGV